MYFTKINTRNKHDHCVSLIENLKVSLPLFQAGQRYNPNSKFPVFTRKYSLKCVINYSVICSEQQRQESLLLHRRKKT